MSFEASVLASTERGALSALHMFEYRVRTSPSGRQLFERSYSFSHNHDHHDHHHHRHHHRTRCFDNCAGISLEQWNSLCQQNKDFIASNDVLTRENQTLKSDLQVTAQENHRLIASNNQMIDEIESLRRSHSHDGENTDKFRRRITALRTEVEHKDRELRHLEKENATLSTRVGVLSQTIKDQARRISDLTSHLFSWQKRSDDFQNLFEDVRSRHEKTKRVLARTQELDNGNAIVAEQRRSIHRLKSPLPSRSYYTSYA
ncbi:hypothetical protein GGR54DRAFT_634943 [Hypoxylon sp. NC1633]|nr:hypothetical protein GGR54DRAFT_634943 [Hypoxylon sp. NC1633]